MGIFLKTKRCNRFKQSLLVNLMMVFKSFSFCIMIFIKSHQGYFYITKVFIVLFFSCSSFRILYSQDIHLSQFNNTPLLRNPALAGIFTGSFRVQTAYRNQWATVSYPYKTNVLGLESKFPLPNGNDYLTVGCSAFSDQAGIQGLKTQQILPVLNFHKSLGQDDISFLSFGFMGGYISRQFSGANLTFDNQYTNGRFSSSNATGENFIGLNRKVLDVAVGMSYNGQLGDNLLYYGGASLWHFNSPSANYLDKEIKLDMKTQANVGIKSFFTEFITLTFEGNYLKQGQYSETIIGGMITYNLLNSFTSQSADSEASALGFGGFLRLNDAFIPYCFLRYNKVEIGVSYDVNISKLKTAAQGVGSIEFSVSYRGFYQLANKSLLFLKCPKF
jgi:type IX secretion system PorP/SprF family membrane protein